MLWEMLLRSPIIFQAITLTCSFRLMPSKRDELMIYLEKNGIQTRTMMPLISQPITKPYLKGKYPVAKYIEEHGILLPCTSVLKEEGLGLLMIEHD
jgi:dTDP-4-amino-4,6-dideoxygalactose transaminase